jgi:hypothetical protein
LIGLRAADHVKTDIFVFFRQSMAVRLYHDAMVAEVCSSQQIYRFKARYDYPNKKLHQRDEKHQINQFLADWLRYCLAYGAMAIPAC